MDHPYKTPEPTRTGLHGGLKVSMQDAIEVKFWEVYLIRSRTNLNNVLSSYSLDKQPQTNTSDPDRVSFRFMRFDWERSIHQMLVDNKVPFEISGHFRIDVFQHMVKKKVYVAENDLNTLFAVNTILENAGYDVILSHSGIPLMQKNLPATDLFILDKRMPDVDGLDVCAHLRTQAATRDIPIVVISASRNFAQKAFKAGATDCLEKPFQMAQLLGLVSKHTGNQVPIRRFHRSQEFPE